jgi:hypothetical protein
VTRPIHRHATVAQVIQTSCRWELLRESGVGENGPKRPRSSIAGGTIEGWLDRVNTTLEKVRA